VLIYQLVTEGQSSRLESDTFAGRQTPQGMRKERRASVQAVRRSLWRELVLRGAGIQFYARPRRGVLSSPLWRLAWRHANKKRKRWTWSSSGVARRA
jgi:hypothetical protein